MPIKSSELSYVVLPGRFCDQQHLSLYENAFHFWYNNWTAVYKDLNADTTANPDDFFKQDFVPVILHGDTIVAIHLYTLYDIRLDCQLKHSYLQHCFNESYFKALRSRGIFKVMSMESLFINMEYRRSRSGFNFVEILASLGLRIFARDTDADAVIAPARVDVGVADVAYSLGFEGIQQNVRLNNVPVDLMIAERDKMIECPTESYRLLVERLWRDRQYAWTSANTVKRAA